MHARMGRMGWIENINGRRKENGAPNDSWGGGRSGSKVPSAERARATGRGRGGDFNFC